MTCEEISVSGPVWLRGGVKEKEGRGGRRKKGSEQFGSDKCTSK